jgi:uncharacterized protein (DUF736 family)
MASFVAVGIAALLIFVVSPKIRTDVNQHVGSAPGPDHRIHALQLRVGEETQSCDAFKIDVITLALKQPHVDVRIQ